MKLLIIFLFMSVHAISQPQLRPGNWATPIINTELKNFYKVSDKLYRSAQPNKNSIKDLQVFGIKSILNLRKHHTDIDEARGNDFQLLHIKMSAKKLTQNQIFQALKMIQDSKTPVLIHCWHGSDRTGTVAAAYRMVFQNWSKTAAIDEFKNGGYGYHDWAFPNLIELLENLDVKALQVKLKLAK